MIEKKNLACCAVIVGAGKGTRMNMDVNKQYVKVCGMEVLARSIEAFEKCGLIDEIVVVVNSQDMDYCRQSIVDRYGFKKVTHITAGGNERQHSVYKGLSSVRTGCDVVLVHDGARPFVDDRIIRDSIKEAWSCGAACAGVPVKDTIKSADTDGYIDSTLDRSKLWSVQTPQAFKFSLIWEAHEKARREGYSGTDDAVLVERLGYRVKFVMGSYENIKITTREDLVFAGAIASGREKA